MIKDKFGITELHPTIVGGREWFSKWDKIYKSIRIIGGKSRSIIVDDTGNIINRSPSKEELNCLEYENYSRNKYTKDELLNYLKIYYEDTGKIPMQIDFEKNPKYPHYATYRSYFGSWNEALKLAGLNNNNRYIYTDEELLNYLKDFRETFGKIPVSTDFINNPEYPTCRTYIKRFGSWNKAMKFAGMDAETNIKQGYLPNEYHKGRLWEIIVRDVWINIKGNIDNKFIDLSGNCGNSIIDGKYSDGKTYDAKSSKFYELVGGGYWHFIARNKDKDDDKEAIQSYIFGAFDKDYTKLIHIWEVPGEIVEEDFYVGTNNIENMEEYDITNEFKKLLQEYNLKKDEKNRYYV